MDRDPKVQIVIDSIEREIRESAACLAEISLDNPNVWYELGYAVACNKPIVMICCDTRTDKFPFDIHHRHVIKYGTNSPSDFIRLKKDITDKLAAARKGSLLSLASMSDPVAQVSGLSQVEIAVLAVMAGNLTSPLTGTHVVTLQNEVEKLGYTATGFALGLRRLLKKKFAEYKMEHGYNSDDYEVWVVSELGWDWVDAHEDLFAIRAQHRRAEVAAVSVSIDNDEIPF